jgi:hypothetical protein
VAQVAGVIANNHYEDSGVSRNQGAEGMHPRIEKINQVDLVVKEENAGLLASALEVFLSRTAISGKRLTWTPRRSAPAMGHERRKLQARGYVPS